MHNITAKNPFPKSIAMISNCRNRNKITKGPKFRMSGGLADNYCSNISSKQNISAEFLLLKRLKPSINKVKYTAKAFTFAI